MATWIYACAALVLVLIGWWLSKARQPTASAKLLPSPPYQPRAIKAPFKPAPYGEVVQYYEQALTRQATAPRFRLLLMAHYNAQAYQAALATSQRFLEALPAGFASSDLVLHAHLYTCVGDPQQAIMLYTRLLEQAVASAIIYNNRGYAYNMAAEYLLAIQDFNQAIARKPNMAYAYNNRGLALLRLGLAAEGRADIERSIKLDSQNAYAYRNLGIYYFDQGNYPAALHLFERAHRLGTAPPELADYLRQTLQQLRLSSAAEEQPPVSD